VAIDTGFRRMELLNFESKQYRNEMLHLHPDETKTSKARSIPATSRVDAIIQARRGNERVFHDLNAYSLRTQWDVVRAALGKTEDPQFVVHMLRHTCASRLAMQDKTAQFIQAWMGHATPLTTARYMHLAPGKLKEGKEALEQYKSEHVPFLRAAN
jgi:integrase